MRIKLDENLPVSLAAGLTGPVATTWKQWPARAWSARLTFPYSVPRFSEERMIFTLDRGFGDIRAYPPGSHPGIVVLRVDDQSARAVTRAALTLVDGHDLEDLAGTVAIAQHGGLRVRRPLP